MINVSSTFLRKLYNDERDYLEKIDMVLADGTELHLSNSNIWQGSFSIDDSVGDDSTFSALGAAVVNSCKVTLNNIYDEFTEYDFKDAVATCYVGLPDVLNGEPEYAKKGIFTVNEAKYNGATIALSMYDNMHKFDVPYSLTQTLYPTNLITIIQDMCALSSIDIDLASSSAAFPRYDFVIQNRPDDQSLTCREVLSWVAAIAGCFARINTDGELEFKWFNTSAFNPDNTLNGGIFDVGQTESYVTGDNADGGSFNPWNPGDEFDGGSLSSGVAHNIYGLFSQDVDVDDVVITKITAVAQTNATTGSEINTNGLYPYSFGTDGYEIRIENNKFITPSNIENVVSYLALQLIGLRFRRVNVSHLSNPTIEAGDVAIVWDRKNYGYNILVTRSCFTVGSAQTTVCGADTPAHNSAARYSEATKSYVEMREFVAKTRTDLQEKIDNANGLYATDVTQPDQSVIHYLHDKPELEDSDIQIMVSTVGITVTANGTDPNPDWYGLTVDGQLIASILTAIGINADWINTGTLTVRDDNNNVVFQVVADPSAQNRGYVKIVATEFSVVVGNVPKTVPEIAEDTATNAINDLEIGGRNLLLGTADAKTATASGSVSTYTSAYEGSYYFEQYCDDANTELTISCDYEILSGTLIGSEKFGAQYNETDIDTSQTGDVSYVVLQNSGSYKVTFKITSAQAALSDHELRFCMMNVNSGVEIKVFNVKLEKGGKRTDWTAAPEDFDTQYAEYQSLVDATLANLQDQIDGQVDTYYYAYAPTTSNEPAATWIAQGIEIDHNGDIFCDTTTDFCYRWLQNNGVWGWEQITDTLASQALARANDAYTMADNKRRVFIVQPTPPYESGDLWMQGSTGDILVCKDSISRVSGDSYVASDWIRASKYTDDSAVNNMVISNRNIILATATTKTSGESFYTDYYDFSTFGKSQLRANVQDNITLTFEYKASNLAASGANTPLLCVEINDLEGNAPTVSLPTGTSYGKYVATFKLTSQQANRGTWHLRIGLKNVNAGYVGIWQLMLGVGTKAMSWVPAPEDTTAEINSAVSGLEATLQPQIDAKIQTWARATDPALQWNTDALKAAHVGDLWCYTGETTSTYTNGATYQYQVENNVYSWADFSATDALFDAIDGKATIYYGSIDDTYEDVSDGDYLVDGNTGSTYRWDASLDEPGWVKETDYDSEIRGVRDEITSVRTELDQRIDGVEITVVQTQGNLDELKTHYRFDADGETIGKSNSDKSIRLSNDGINMMVEGESVTRWNQDEMYTPRKITVPVSGSLQLGDFIFQPRSNGNMSLFFVGD